MVTIHFRNIIIRYGFPRQREGRTFSSPSPRLPRKGKYVINLELASLGTTKSKFRGGGFGSEKFRDLWEPALESQICSNADSGDFSQPQRLARLDDP